MTSERADDTVMFPPDMGPAAFVGGKTCGIPLSDEGGNQLEAYVTVRLYGLERGRSVIQYAIAEGSELAEAYQADPVVGWGRFTEVVKRELDDLLDPDTLADLD